MRVVVCQFEGIDATPVLPLAAGCLVATARADAELGPACELDIALERKAIDAAVAELGADVIGFSLYPWNCTYSLAVAAAAKRASPDALIVVGGPSVPRVPERARRFLDDHPYVDVMVFSEGEVTFCEILRARLRGAPLDTIGGIAIRGEEQHVVTDPPARVLAFQAGASPYLDGTFDTLFARYPGKFVMALCETNRGCPFSCTFCDWSLTKRVVEFPVERVEAELDWVVDHGITHVMLSDANFGIRPRDLRIVNYIAHLRRTRGIPRSFYWYLTKNNHQRNLETIEILHDAGISTWVGLAVQDFDDEVLAAVKRDNIQTGESRSLRRICASRGIPTFNELILGLPGQTYTSFVATMAEGMPPFPRHDFVLFLCRLIDNAELGSAASRAQFGLETRRCQWKTSTPGFDPIVEEFQEVVVGTRDLPPADWHRAYRLGFLAASLYNLRLLRVVLGFVGENADLGAYVAWLAERLLDAPEGTVYAEMSAIIDRFALSVLASGPLVMTVDPDVPEVLGYVDDAVANRVLARYDRFLAETEAYTEAFFASTQGAAPIALGEAFRYQRLIIPRPGRTEPVEVVFRHDWPTWSVGCGEPLRPGDTSVHYTPPYYAMTQSFSAFAVSHFASIRARLDTGTVLTSACALVPGVLPPMVAAPASG